MGKHFANEDEKRVWLAIFRGDVDGLEDCLTTVPDAVTAVADRPDTIGNAFQNPDTTSRIFALLERAGFDMNKPDGDGCTALWFATTEGHVEVAKALLLAGANPSPVTCRPLLGAVQFEDENRAIELVGLMAESSANVNELFEDEMTGNFFTPLDAADGKVAKLLRKFGAKTAIELGVEN